MIPVRGKQEQDKQIPPTAECGGIRAPLRTNQRTDNMNKTNILHVASQAGSEDGRNFPVNDFEFTMMVFARQFEDEDARAAYISNFLAEMGRRTNPVNDVPTMRRFQFA